MSDRRGRARFLLISALVAMLTACTVQLVSDYDEQIDAGLTQANTDIAAFVNRMVDVAGTPAGEYIANQDFYSAEQARLGTLRIRAEAHRVLNSCPSAAVTRSAITSSFPQQQVSGPIPTLTAQQVIAKLPDDDCGVVLISLIQDSFTDLKTFHQAQGRKGVPASARDPILIGGIGSLLRSAIQVQVALKWRKTSGGS